MDTRSKSSRFHLSEHQVEGKDLVIRTNCDQNATKLRRILVTICPDDQVLELRD